MTEVTKSSDEILTELFDSFKAEAAVDVSDSSVTLRSPKDEQTKSKKKRKKDKKHKNGEKDRHRKKKKCKRHKKKESSYPSDKSSKPKKKKKRKFSGDSCDSDLEGKQNHKTVNVESCNKENSLPEEKGISEIATNNLNSVVNNFDVTCDTSSIPLPPSVGDSIPTSKGAQEVPEVKKPQVSEVFEKHAENPGRPPKKLFLQGLDKPKMSIKIGNLKNSQVLEAAEEAKIKADKYEEGGINDEIVEESTKLLMKIEVETTSDNGSFDNKKQELLSDLKRYGKREKSSDSSNINSSVSSSDFKSDEHKCTLLQVGRNDPQFKEETSSAKETLEKINPKNNEKDSSLTISIFDNKNQHKLKKLRQLRERKLGNSSSENESSNALKSPSSKSAKECKKKAANKRKKRNNRSNSTSDSDRSSSSSGSSSSLERSKNARSKNTADIKTSGKVSVNSGAKRNFSPRTKRRESKSSDRSPSANKHSSSKTKRSKSPSRSELMESRSDSKSRIRNSRSQSRYFNRKSRSTSRSRKRNSTSRSLERRSRSISYSRSRRRRSTSRSRVKRSKTPKKYSSRKSRSVSKHKKSSPSRTKTKKSRSSSRSKTRRSISLSKSKERRSRSYSRSTKRKSRSRGRKSSRSPFKAHPSKLVSHRSNSRSNYIRSISRHRSTSKSRHSMSENRRSRSKNKRSSKLRSRSKERHSRSKQLGVKNFKEKKERRGRSSSSKRSCSKLSDSSSEKSEYNSKFKGSSKKKSKENKSSTKKLKSKHMDINSRLLALSSTKIDSSSEDSVSDSGSDDSINDRKKTGKLGNLKKDKNNHSSDDKKSKINKSRKDLDGMKAKDNSVDSNSKIFKEADLPLDSNNSKPIINLRQKIHYSLIDDEPIAMTESEMKILNAKNKTLSKAVFSTKNLFEKEEKDKDLPGIKKLKSKQENKAKSIDVIKNSKLDEQLKKQSNDEINKVITDNSSKKVEIDELTPEEKSEDALQIAKEHDFCLIKSENEDIGKADNSSEKQANIDKNEISAEHTPLTNITNEKNKKGLDKKDVIPNKFSHTSTKNYFKDKVKGSDSELELPLSAKCYDSDGQRSDTAMRNVFLGSQSSSNSPVLEIASFTEKNINKNLNSEESASESVEEKTLFGISKDCVETIYEYSSKVESSVGAETNSSESNGSHIDKNITDSDEDLTSRKKQILPNKHISNFTVDNQKDHLLLKPNFSAKECLVVAHSEEYNKSSNMNSNKVTSSIALTKQLFTLKETTSIKGNSSGSKGKNEIVSDLSPKRTNSQDFLFDYGKSEIEDDKLDFDEDKSSESDVGIPSKLKEEINILNEKEKPDLTVFDLKVIQEVDIDEHDMNQSAKNIKEDISIPQISEKTPGCDGDIIKEDIVSEKIVSLEKTSCDQTSSNNTQVLVPNRSNAVTSTTNISVPSVDKLDDIRIPFSCNDKEELNELKKSDSTILMVDETKRKSSDKVGSDVDKENVIASHFVEKELVIPRMHGSIENMTESPLLADTTEDKKQKFSTSIIKSVSRSRSRSKINKSSSKVERSKSKSRSDLSSSRRSKSKNKSTSIRSKSKEKSSTRKGRSKSREKRSHSKSRHSRSKESRKQSKGRSLSSSSGRSRSKDKSSRLKDRRSRSRRCASGSRRRTRSRDRSSRSKRRNQSKSRDKRSRSRERRKRSRSHNKRSRSRGARDNSHSRERRSRSRRQRGRSQSSRDKRSRSHTRKVHSRTRSKDRSKSKDKKSKNDFEHFESSKVKLHSRSKSLEKNSEIISNSNDKKTLSSTEQERPKSIDKLLSKKEDKNSVEELEAIDKTILITKSSPVRIRSNLKSAGIKAFSRSKSTEDRSSSEKEISTKTSSSEKSSVRSWVEKSPSPLSSSNNSVPDPKKCRSRSNSTSNNIGNNSVNKKTKSPNIKLKRSRTKSPGTIKPKRSRTKSPESKIRRTRSKSREKLKIKEKRTKSKDRSLSKEVKSKVKGRKSRSRDMKSKTDEKSSKSQRKRSRTRSKSKEKNKPRDKRSRSRERRSKSRDKKTRRSRSRSRRRKSDKKDRSRRTRSRSKSRSRKRSKKSRSRSRSKDEFFIDKSKLLEIARKNALSMMKQGAVGTDLNKVTAITAGGKTVDELTDFCKLLSQKDATGQESVSSESSSENESEKPFHHPFQLKERSNNIIMNIRNCASLPVKTHLEKTTENAQQLRLQFPVSSGQLHRKSENEWIPVSPKKTDELKAIMPAPVRKQEEDLPMYPGLQETAHFSNIPLPNSTPHPQPHLSTLPQMGNPWPKPHDSGLFTGTTGARFLSQAELASGHQAWAKKDQLISAQPVCGGMGMSLLQKMGWKPGEGLGKRNEGTLEPLKLQVKMDKRGLVCADEIPQPRFRPHHIPKNQPAKSLEGKHPVSLLVEYCTRKHLNPPLFTVLLEDGPAHKKSFVFKVTVNGVDYQPPNPSPNKKQAKSEAAVLCLRALGLLPTT